MAAFKIPTFQERTAAAQEAKRRAVEKLKNVGAQTTAAAATAEPSARDIAAAERRAAHKAAIEQEKAARQEARAAAQAEKEAAEERAAAARRPGPMPTLPTQAELKAARDARYAARKARNR